MNLFDIINVPLGYLMKLCYTLVPNYAIALFLFALIIKIVLFPLGIKQQKNSVRQAELRPKEKAIRNRYAGRTDKATQMKMNEEIQQLYQAENFNPAGGCLPMLVELPIIFALYNVITSPLKYLLNWSDDVISAIAARLTELELAASANISHIEMINHMKADFGTFADLVPEGFTADMFPNFNVFGNFLDLSQVPSFTEPSWLLVIPALTFIASFGSMKLTRRFTYQPQTDEQTALSMKIMDLTMPLFSVWIAFSVPATIGLYWVYQNILSAGRQMILYKLYPVPHFTEEDYKKAEAEMNGKLSKSQKKKLKARSLHNIDADDEPQTEETNKESTENVEKKNALDVGKIKDETAKPKEEANKEKKKVRSLHNIDKEIPDTPENTLMLDENGKRIRSPKTEENAENKGETDGEKK